MKSWTRHSVTSLLRIATSRISYGLRKPHMLRRAFGFAACPKTALL